jgi:hypothetical protein
VRLVVSKNAVELAALLRAGNDGPASDDGWEAEPALLDPLDEAKTAPPPVPAIALPPQDTTQTQTELTVWLKAGLQVIKLCIMRPRSCSLF